METAFRWLGSGKVGVVQVCFFLVVVVVVVLALVVVVVVVVVMVVVVVVVVKRSRSWSRSFLCVSFLYQELGSLTACRAQPLNSI